MQTRAPTQKVLTSMKDENSSVMADPSPDRRNLSASLWMRSEQDLGAQHLATPPSEHWADVGRS